VRFIVFFLISFQIFAQNSLEIFLKPSDTIKQKRKSIVYITGGSAITLGLVGLNQLWYKDYPKSSFHTINDINDWQQMDKIGHFYSSYHLSKIGSDLVKWTGSNSKNQLIFGASVGLLFLTTVEIMDGHAQQWGFSWSDMAANTLGTALYVSQEILWKEQRITPKFSYHNTNFAALRPNTLGNTFTEKILKDYNAQTYWLSFNVQSFIKNDKIPKWLNIAIGYGADGMLTANTETENQLNLPITDRNRNLFLSIDLDLTKIKTNSHLLKTLFSTVNLLKIPAPTFQINQSGKTTWYGIYY
jgi:uncharacterized protein YfiM (DUF2279 family)